MNRRYAYVGLGLLVAALAGVAQVALAQGSGRLGEQLRAFWAEVQVGMAEREEELRTALGLDGTHDLVDAQL